MPATTAPTLTGEPFDDLEELCGRMLGQWATELSHVAAIVGGFNSQQKHVGRLACDSRRCRASVRRAR